MIYSVPLETLYYSSGCMAEYSKDSSEVILRFIRQRVNTAFSGNLKSEFLRDSNNAPVYKMNLPSKLERLTIREPKKILMVEDLLR